MEKLFSILLLTGILKNCFVHSNGYHGAIMNLHCQYYTFNIDSVSYKDVSMVIDRKGWNITVIASNC